MGSRQEGVANTRAEDMDSDTQPLIRPRNDIRKSSISDSLTRFTSFHRRRTTTDPDSSSSVVSVVPTSRLPTPAGVSRSNSFFRSLGSFNSKPANLLEKDRPSASVTVKRIPRQPDTQPSTPPSDQAPVCRGKTRTPFPSYKKREHSVQILQHSLMQPIRPGIPRSSTVGNLGQQTSSTRTPSFMRPTSSSAARRQSQSSGFVQSFSSRQIRPARLFPAAQAVSKHYFMKQHVKEAKQQSKKPGNTNDDAFLLSPAKEVDEEEIEYATDEDIDVGTATPMTISPVRSVSSHNPYSDNNFAYGSPQKHDKHRRESGRPFEHLVARPVHFSPSKARRDSKPLPALTPDRSQGQQYDFGHSHEMSHFTERDSGEYYRSRNIQPLMRSTSDLHLGEEPKAPSDYPLGGYDNYLFGEDYDPAADWLLKEDDKPQTAHAANKIGRDEYDEENTVIHTVEGELIKGSFASPSNSEAASEADFANEGDNDHTTSTITALPHEDNAQGIYDSLPTATWLGRVTSLSDRFRTEALAESMNALAPLSIHDISSPTHISHPMHDDNRRYHRVFMHLQSLCETDEARESLRHFQHWWEAKRAKEYGGGNFSYGGSGYGSTVFGSGNVKGGNTAGGAAGGGKGGDGKVKQKRGVFEKLGLRRKSGL